jgi:hypothetical protein
MVERGRQGVPERDGLVDRQDDRVVLGRAERHALPLLDHDDVSICGDPELLPPKRLLLVHAAHRS